MWWLFFNNWAQAHPFSAQFFGHDVNCTILDSEIVLQYQLEIPTSYLQYAWQEDSKQGSTDKELWLRTWHETIASDFQLFFNQESQLWQERYFSEIESRNEGKFIAFVLELHHQLPPEISEISLINRNLMTEKSIYRNQVFIDDAIVVRNTDQVFWRDGQPFAPKLDQWDVEDQAREMRFVIAHHPRFWGNIRKYFRQNYLQPINTAESMTLWDALKPHHFWEDWKQGYTRLSSYLLGCMLSICALVFQQPLQKKEKWFQWIFIAGLATCPILPWRWSIASMICTMIVPVLYQSRSVFLWGLWLWMWVIHPHYWTLPLMIAPHFFARQGWEFDKKGQFLVVFVFFGGFVQFYT